MIFYFYRIQKKNMDQGTRDDRDKKEQEKLEKYRMNKMIVERIPARHEVQSIGKPTDEIDIEEPEEESQITRTTLYDIINGLNELIRDLRRAGIWDKENKERLEKLKKIRAEAENEKAKFERVRPKPRGWGYLRR
jgi:hypothetical protein